MVRFRKPVSGLRAKAVGARHNDKKAAQVMVRSMELLKPVVGRSSLAVGQRRTNDQSLEEYHSDTQLALQVRGRGRPRHTIKKKKASCEKARGLGEGCGRRYPLPNYLGGAC